MNKQILTTFIMSVLLLFSSCADKEEPAQITISESSIEYFQDRMDFSSEGGSQIIKFSTNKNWEISVSESGMGVDWCTVSPKSGTPGDVAFTITVSENLSYGERSVILTLTAGDATKKLRVSQKQNDAILISSTLYEIPMEGGEFELEVKSNVNYQVEIPKQYNTWIHKGATTRVLESNNLNFTVDSNEDYDKREGEIIISDGNITEVIKVYQAGGGILVLSQNEYNISSDGATITVDLSSNFEYEFELPNVDWIKLNDGTKGMSSHSIHFDVLPNEGYDNRSTTIRFFDTTSSVSETVIINQVQKDALFLYTPNNNALSYKEQTFEINLLTNTEFEIFIDSEWISYRSTRGLSESSILLFIAENNSPDHRYGQVILRNDSFVQIIDITQYGLPIDLSSNRTANSYIVPLEDTYFCLDASVAGNDKSYLLPKGVRASVVWPNHYSQSSLVDNVEYESEKGRIIFRAKQADGNALIALFDKDDNIIWSWHLWLTDYNPDEDFITFNNGSILMDRYLGASSEEGIGLYYQWGRKDPFAPGAYAYFRPSGTPITIEYCNSHPNTFIGGDYDSTNWDWNTEHTAIWSSSKSVYDPCPPGWKVMDDTAIPSLSEGCFVDENSLCFIIGEPNCTQQTKFRFTGLLHSAGGIQGTSEHISMWTNRGGYHNFYTGLEKGLSKWQNETKFRDGYVGRAYGQCIRCQRE